MPREVSIYLRDVLDSVELIQAYTRGLSLEKFSADRAIQDAVERRFEIIGEALTRCKRHFPAEIIRLGDIQAIIDFRNHLAYRYDTIDSEVVWEIVMDDLPSLLSRVSAVLDEVEREVPSIE